MSRSSSGGNPDGLSTTSSRTVCGQKDSFWIPNPVLLGSPDLRGDAKFYKICPKHEEFMSEACPSDGGIEFDLRTADAPADRDARHYSLTHSERHKLLVEWNQTRTQYPRDT